MKVFKISIIQENFFILPYASNAAEGSDITRKTLKPVTSHASLKWKI